MVKRFVRDLRVQIWGLPYTEVDAENAVVYLPAGGGGGTPNHYFLCERKGIDGVTVRAGATQQIGSDPVARAGSGGDEFVVENLTESSVLYAHYKRDTGEWDTAATGFIKPAAIDSLPTSDGENDYRPIAYITVEGTGITEIEQAHVGVLREPQQLPDGSEDGEIFYWDEAAEKWTVLSAPINKSVLMYDPAAAVGSKLQWVEVDTFTCE